MNINQLMRGLFGESQPAEAKTLELKVGQIVKGIVLQLFSELDALVSISGVQVRAKLESPLQRGQITMLQVQPESTGGQIILKPMQRSAVPISEQSLTEIIRDYGIKDVPEQRQLLQQMHQHGLEIAKENVNRFQSVLGMRPVSSHLSDWIQASVLADKKGLPLTKDTIGSLHQVMYGTSFYEQLDALDSKITSFLASTASKGHPFEQKAETLAGVLRQIRWLTDAIGLGIEGRTANANSDPSGYSDNVGKSSGNLQLTHHQHQETSNKGMANGDRTQAGKLLEKTNDTANAGTPFVSMEEQFDNHEPLGRRSERNKRDVLFNDARNSQVKEQIAQSEKNAAKGDQNPAQIERGWRLNSTPAAGEHEGGKLIQRLLRWIGIDHEHNLLTRQADGDLSKTLEMSTLAANDAYEDSAPNVTDTLKNALLTLQQSDDVPLSLKESGQQLLQHITGQQLHAVGDRDALFTHVTLFVPIKNELGNQTAAIQIQSKKGPRGELDSNNCRLLFDLRMGALGETVVDVQVVDRIVALQVHNDHPLIAPLLHSQRTEISSAIQAVGYKFLSLKAVPFPKKIEGEVGSSMHGIVDKKALAASVYGGKAYKGMDLRV